MKKISAKLMKQVEAKLVESGFKAPFKFAQNERYSPLLDIKSLERQIEQLESQPHDSTYFKKLKSLISRLEAVREGYEPFNENKPYSEWTDEDFLHNYQKK